MPKKDAGAAGITVHLRVRPSKKASNFFESKTSLADGGRAAALADSERPPARRGPRRRVRQQLEAEPPLPLRLDHPDGRDAGGRVRDGRAGGGRERARRLQLDRVRVRPDGLGQDLHDHRRARAHTGRAGSSRARSRRSSPRSASARDAQWTAHVSYLELYNEQGFDLLDPSHDTKALEDLPRVKMLEDEDGNFHLRNLSMHRAESEEDALNLLFLGDTNRAISETAMNQASSRSHCIFTLFVEGRKVGSDRVMRAKLHLVDLAGSERVHKTKSDGQTLREAQFINTSLFFLEMVIVALGEKSQGKGGRTHVPYRNSMMTSVLRDSLGGNCKTIMVATISAEAAQTEESLSTCRFAQRVALVKNDALVNEDVDPAQQIVRLKGEVSNLKAEVAYLKGEAGEGAPVTDDERAALRAAREAYVGSRDPHAALAIGSYTRAKIHDCFAILKNLVLDARDAARAAAAAAARTATAPGRDAREEGGASAELEEELARAAHAARARERDRDPRQHGQAGQGRAARQRGGVRARRRRRRRRRARSPAPSSAAAPSPVSRDADAKSGFGGGGGGGGGAKPAGGGAARPRAARSIGGVAVALPPESERELLEEPAAALGWFRERYAANATAEENKHVLKEKYALAKAMGERVNAARGRIEYHKKSIEAIRRERAMEREGLVGDDGAAARGDDGGDDAAEREESDEEREHKAAIEAEKATYKESFAALRELKKEIEHIQRLLEKGRAKLQADFDQWYDAVLRLGQARRPRAARGRRRRPPRRARARPGARAEAKHGAGDGAGGDAKRAGLLTGNKDADDDIRAFFKAKDELLRRQQQQAAS